MNLENLITELSSLRKMLFVVGSDSAVSEAYVSPKNSPIFDGGWAEIRGRDWHLHMNLASVKGVQFVEADEHGLTLYYVRFSNEEGETIVRAYFPNPYLDDNENITEFQPGKLKLFEDVKDRYVGHGGIIFVRRSHG